MSGDDFLAESLKMTLLMTFFEVDLVYCALQQDWGRGRGRHWLPARNHSHIIALQQPREGKMRGERRRRRKCKKEVKHLKCWKVRGRRQHGNAWTGVSSHGQGYFTAGCLVNPPSSLLKAKSQTQVHRKILNYQIFLTTCLGEPSERK